MGTTADRLLLGFQRALLAGGLPISVKYYTQTTGSIYDEPSALAQSGGTVWTSGVVFTLDPKSSEDNLLLEQGKLADSDIKLYTAGSLVLSPTSGSVLQTKIGIGSPARDQYSIIPLGANAQEVSNVQIYKLAYLRRLSAGSFIGE